MIQESTFDTPKDRGSRAGGAGPRTSRAERAQARQDGSVANERARIALTSDEVDALLRTARRMVLVTTGPDGVPDPVPMWFVLDDAGDVLMRTYAASQKVRNLERDARFAALVDSGEHYVELKGAQLTGTVEVVDDVDHVCDVFAALMVKYEGLDPEHVDAVRTAYRDRAPKQRVLRLHVTRVVSWDHGKQASLAASTE
jgi:PPOX class probable F420-dependent enzyme